MDHLLKRREIAAGYMSAFQYEIDIFFLRKKCGLYIEKANQCPVLSLHAIQLNTFTRNEAVTKLKYLST